MSFCGCFLTFHVSILQSSRPVTVGLNIKMLFLVEKSGMVHAVSKLVNAYLPFIPHLTFSTFLPCLSESMP